MKRVLLIIVILIVGFFGCQPDDTSSRTAAPPRDRNAQQIIDIDTLVGYLETHYYNASTFDTPGNYSILDIVISELPKDINGNYLDLPDPDNNTLLIDDVELFTETFLDVEYEYYILRLNQGGGEMPNFTDDIFVTYEGLLMSGEIFDAAVNPTTFDLTGVVEGWRRVFPKFNTATNFMENPDGTLSFDNSGLGVMFLPSGLGYFNAPPLLSGINAYENLIFKFGLFRTQVNDHDEDLVLTHNEDIDENKDVFDDDTDNDGIPDFFDPDDDNDDVLTINEDLDNDGDPRNDDTDGDGIPNYLDKDDAISNEDE